MSLLKRIGGSGPLDGTANVNVPAPNGQTTTGALGTQAPPTNVLPRQTSQMPQTGRLSGQPDTSGRGAGMSNQENMLELKNRVQQKLIAELDPKLDLTK